MFVSPEQPKGAKDKFKKLEGPPARNPVAEGLLRLLGSKITEKLCTTLEVTNFKVLNMLRLVK